MVRELKAEIERSGRPVMIVFDDRADLAANANLIWSTEHKVEWLRIPPGKPV